MKTKTTYRLQCPYCGSYAVCRPAYTVYGHGTIDRQAYLYICPNWPSCDAYVGAHKKDHSPMGTLANGQLRHKRILAHRALEKLQKERRMDRWAAYVWIQANLNLDREHAHIGMFTEKMCDRLISLCRHSQPQPQDKPHGSLAA